MLRWAVRGARWAGFGATAAALLAAPAARAQDPACAGDVQADQVAPAPNPHALTFGITPGIQTGQLGTGPVPPRLPDDPPKTLAALKSLKPRTGPLVLRLNRFFWSDGEDGVKRFLALKNRYTSQGFLVELQLRYHPSPEQEGDIDAWVKHVRDVVDRFGADPRVVGIQVANEVNLGFSPDSSDGGYARAKDALIQGVEAAHDEKLKRGYGQLEIGFNWAYRNSPQAEQDFWTYLRDSGGPAFVKALDWFALDVYPGTFIPPVNTPGGERDAVVNAVSVLRECYAPLAGLTNAMPLHIEENGYPTAEPTRTYARQAQIAENMIRTFHDYSANWNITDYRWFNLRDSDSTSPNFQQQYGLLKDDYTPKPAFAVVRDLFAELGVKPSKTSSRTGARVSCAHKIVTALPATARSADFYIDGKFTKRDTQAPFEAAVPTAGGRHRVTVRTVRFDGGGGRRTLAFRCR